MRAEEHRARTWPRWQPGRRPDVAGARVAAQPCSRDDPVAVDLYVQFGEKTTPPPAIGRLPGTLGEEEDAPLREERPDVFVPLRQGLAVDEELVVCVDRDAERLAGEDREFDIAKSRVQRPTLDLPHDDVV